jgi:PAS domain S-box-containing protein
VADSPTASAGSELTRLIPTILAATPQAIWVVGADGRVLYANPTALRMLGYDALDELIGRDSHRLLHPVHPDGTPYAATECRMLEPVRTGSAVSGEEWGRRRDGSFIPIAWSSAPIDVPGGRGAVHAFMDITERRELERQTRERELAELRRAELHDAHIRLMENIASARSEIARDLHDGAQQRLVALALQARLLRETLGNAALENAAPGSTAQGSTAQKSAPDSDAVTGSAAALLDGIASDAQAAIDELRELAAGIHPTILTSRGIAAAIRSQADHCPIPVEVEDGLEGRRFSALVESNAYFFVAEALTNAAKHSRAGRIDVRLVLDGQGLTLVVADDGIGGIRLERAGTGLHSMVDRVHAFEGTVEIDSPAGAGTVVRAVIPGGVLAT